MTTPTIIVDGRSPTGKRISVSFDECLWSLYVASQGANQTEARKELKAQMQEGIISNSYQAKRWIYGIIAKPDLLAHSQLA